MRDLDLAHAPPQSTDANFACGRRTWIEPARTLVRVHDDATGLASIIHSHVMR